MTDVSSTPEKVATRRGLFRLGEKALEAQGWAISRVPRGGKSSLRQITRGKETKKVSIRTSQDTWIAFPRRPDGSWVTLDEVDFVVAVSVNDRLSPTEARVHMIPGEEARDRFNRAYAARDKARHTQPDGRGIWLSLYDRETPDGPVAHVGGGMGIDYKPILVHDLRKHPLAVDGEPVGVAGDLASIAPAPSGDAATPLTISEAKRRLAQTLGVPESAIRITVEH
jgi:ribosomal protein L14